MFVPRYRRIRLAATAGIVCHRLAPSIATASKKFRKDCFVKGAKRRLRRSKTLDKTILSKQTATVAIDGFL
jgi:hypothetical protein